MATSSPSAGVVAAALDVTLERPAVGAGAEAAPRTGDDDDPHRRVVGGPGEQGPVLGVHPTGPGVEALGPVQGDGGDAVAHVVAGDLQLGELHSQSRVS